MPNLVGIFDPADTADALNHALARMMTAVDLPSFKFEKRSATGSDLAVGNVLPGFENNLAQPARDPTRDLWLMLDGEILGVAELVAELRRVGVDAAGKDDAELALLAYVAFGEAFLEKLNGTWILVLHDARNQSTLVATDRMGVRLLYYAHDGQRFVFGTELKGVIAGRKVKSRAGGLGLYALLHSGGHHGDHTWVDGISLLPAGTKVRLSRNGTKFERYWKLRFREGGPEMSEADYADGFARQMRAATERCMKQHGQWPIAITLSGGLDSRAVALALDRVYLPLRAITYGSEASADVRYARQLAGVIGLEHIYIEPEYEALAAESQRVYRDLVGQKGEPGFYSAQLDRILWRSENLSLFEGLGSTIWHPRYIQMMRFMLNGTAGDAMTGSHLGPELLLSPRRDQIIRKLEQQRFFQSPELIRQVLHPQFVQRHQDQLSPFFAGTFSEIDADNPLNISNIWDLENRQRRGAFTSYAMERYFCGCRSPFVDYALVDYLARVPPLWRFQQRIYKRMLVDHFPEAAHVPWAYTEGRITTSPTFEFAREAFNFAKARALRFLPGQANRPARWLFRDTTKMIREDRWLFESLERFTRSEFFPADVLDPSGVRQLAKNFAENGDPYTKAMFGQLVGLARAIELFLVPEQIQVPPVADPAVFGVAP